MRREWYQRRREAREAAKRPPPPIPRTREALQVELERLLLAGEVTTGQAALARVLLEAARPAEVAPEPVVPAEESPTRPLILSRAAARARLTAERAAVPPRELDENDRIIATARDVEGNLL